VMTGRNTIAARVKDNTSSRELHYRHSAREKKYRDNTVHKEKEKQTSFRLEEYSNKKAKRQCTNGFEADKSETITFRFYFRRNQPRDAQAAMAWRSRRCEARQRLSAEAAGAPSLIYFRKTREKAAVSARRALISAIAAKTKARTLGTSNSSRPERQAGCLWNSKRLKPSPHVLRHLLKSFLHLLWLSSVLHLVGPYTSTTAIPQS